MLEALCEHFESEAGQCSGTHFQCLRLTSPKAPKVEVAMMKVITLAEEGIRWKDDAIEAEMALNLLTIFWYAQ